MGSDGFSGPSSLLYHTHPPTRVMGTKTLREESVDPSLFTMPEGYDEVPLFDLGGAGVTADSKDKKDDPLNDLGGLFDSKEKGE